ncbi:hypothetical protein Krac_10543 [Ktedonobacter racemifer DSM 44963]|uniref:Uncharacterized protein n=1 Tax=Ktedonobacter racemifer DSM 44963 TaxID=485913 RepID=D6THL6_KTERA|nr:hypothetical protein Krac_10543 [Ktedonobacter racemifer DSM 44963]
MASSLAVLANRNICILAIITIQDIPFRFWTLPVYRESRAYQERFKEPLYGLWWKKSQYVPTKSGLKNHSMGYGGKMPQAFFHHSPYLCEASQTLRNLCEQCKIGSGSFSRKGIRVEHDRYWKSITRMGFSTQG